MVTYVLGIDFYFLYGEVCSGTCKKHNVLTNLHAGVRLFTASAFLVWCLGRQSLTEYALLVTSRNPSFLYYLVSVIRWWSMQPAVHCPWSVLLHTFCWWSNRISVIEPLMPLNIVCCGACHLNSLLSFIQRSSVLVRWSKITSPSFLKPCLTTHACGEKLDTAF